ncbi:DUF397 domain-containing protein [Umezawaea tangerina]|uniref:Uncharacterized protein DUF397 n=1 Tax=Umezawaea tangerina TaxID=84725 RepID=A0A2T0TKV8_9PSEU|nr:DUF397 domain-containing protein [Umezawaea tangerina]PRY46251.1 uncharacterized protein DUF397 [Umezawaea tangerina]
MSELVWRRSSYSGGGGNECVELAFPPAVVAVRDSKNPDGPRLVFPRAALVVLLRLAR